MRAHGGAGCGDRACFFHRRDFGQHQVRLYGRCARGERLVTPQGHWKTITFVAALRRHGMRAAQTIDGAMTGKKSRLCPTAICPNAQNAEIVS